LTALQLALQNVFDLLKYAMTLAAARPSEFKWTALGSFVAVGAGVACYAVYLRSMRGHLVHLDWIKRC
jgi:iron-regulated transporter 1